MYCLSVWRQRFNKVFGVCSTTKVKNKQTKVSREGESEVSGEQCDWCLMRLTIHMCKHGWAASLCVHVWSLLCLLFVYMALSSLIVLLVLNECHCKAPVYLRLFISVTVFTWTVCSLWFKAYWKADFVTCRYLVCLGSHCWTGASKLNPHGSECSLFILLNSG